MNRAALFALFTILTVAAAVASCTHGTTLAPLDQQLAQGAKRADAFIVTRQDGGMPRADRLLAESACGNIAAILQHAHLDAGAPCP